MCLAADFNISSYISEAKPDYLHLLAQEKNKKKRILSSSDNDTGLWSNAFNFEKSWTAEVDPRTGILAVHFKVGSLLSNMGHGPNINLQINYNNNTLSNPDGIGLGWGWNLTHFNAMTNQLTTANGQSFWLYKIGKNNWQPLYHKLHDIKIEGDKSTHFTLIYANGLKEVLSHDGYETRLDQQNGWGVNFIYQPGTHLLKLITDDEGNAIAIDRNQGSLEIVSHKINGEPAAIRIKNNNSMPEIITFPSDAQVTNQPLKLSYKNHLLTHIIYPTGLDKTFTFNCTDAMKFSTSLSNHFHSLCVVVNEQTNPGAGQPAMKNHYLYSDANINGHNYLGFNSGLNSITNTQKDKLFEAPVGYVYQTIKDNGLTKEVHTYNKYHLLIDNKLVNNYTGKILSEAEYFFCSTKMHDSCSQTSFKNLPVTYSLPLKIVNRVWDSYPELPAVTTITREYDNFGRTIRSTDTYGRVMRIHYCPVEGDLQCPASPGGYFFSMLPESVTLNPASDTTKKTSPSYNTTYNFYRKQFNLNSHGYILVLDHQIHQSDYQHTMLYRDYYTNRHNALTYGLIKQTIFTNTTPDSPHAVVYNYNYIENKKNYSRITNVSVKAGPEKWQNLSSVTTSLFTNQVLERTGMSGCNKRNYHYDSFGHLIQTDLNSGTIFAAKLYYQYILAPGHNQVIMTAVNKLQQKILFDNAGRSLMYFNEAVSIFGKAIPGHWQLKKSIRYDSYNRITEQDIYVKSATGEIYSLKTVKNYDVMGRINRIYLSDGEINFFLYSNYYNCMVSYRQNNHNERSPVYIQQVNLLGKPIKKRIIPASSTRLPSVKSLCSLKNMAPDTAKTETTTYDGWGRPVMIKDNMGRVTQINYDSFGHPNDITDSVGNHIHCVYNLTGQVTERWALPVSGGRYLLSSAGYNNAGQLLYKTGEDRKKTTFTYTAIGELATEVTPGGHQFFWKYNEAGLPVEKYADGKILLQTDYDHITAKPVKKHDITGVTVWHYSVDGLLKKKIHTGENGYPDYQLSWHYDKNRRIISRTDIEGNEMCITYDKLGRISALSYHSDQEGTQILYKPVYDAFSHVSSIHYGSGMQRIVHYDNWGRQHTVTDTLENQLLSRWTFNYNLRDNIIVLHQQTENDQEAILHYRYDQLDNLVSMHCSGSVNLPLCPRDTSFSGLKKAPIITSQHYTFTPLNRLSRVKESLQNNDKSQTLNKIITYHYNNVTAPLRLQKEDIQWNQKTSVTQYFYYDSAGNMSLDGEGNKITYNFFNEVTSVVKTNGEKSYYVYDGSGRENLEKSRSGQHYFFYNGNRVINEKISNRTDKNHLIGYHGVARTIDGVIREYAEQNYKNDVTGILTKTADNSHTYRLAIRNVYSPYGMVWHKQITPFTLSVKNFFGYDGERTDPATGWQFLGAGHRVYNPQQRYFVSEDLAGNGYAFSSNNPVMKTDPSGDTSKASKEMFKIFRYIGTFGLSAIHGRWGDFAGSLIMFGVSTLCFPMAIASATGSSVFGAIAGTGISLLGMAPIVASFTPTNKGTEIIVAIMGIIQLSVVVASIAYAWPHICSTLSSLEKLTRKVLGTSDEAADISISIGDSFSFSAEHSSIESIEMKSYASSESVGYIQEKSLETLVQNVQTREPQQLFTTGNENFLYVKSFDDIQQVQNQLNAFDNDTGIILAAAALRKKPLDMEKLQNYLLIRNQATVLSTEYRNAFRNLMNDLDLSANITENNNISVEQLFPAENSTTLLLNHQYARILTRQSADCFSSLSFNSVGAIKYAEKNYSDVTELLSDESVPVSAYEYYYIY